MAPINVIVTGGAGYIGSHACRALKAAGYTPICVDNLSTGWADAVKFGPLENVDLLDQSKLEDVFRKYQPRAVMHFAAFSQVGFCGNVSDCVCLCKRFKAHSILLSRATWSR